MRKRSTLKAISKRVFEHCRHSDSFNWRRWTSQVWRRGRGAGGEIGEGGEAAARGLRGGATTDGGEVGGGHRGAWGREARCILMPLALKASLQWPRLRDPCLRIFSFWRESIFFSFLERAGRALTFLTTVSGALLSLARVALFGSQSSLRITASKSHLRWRGSASANPHSSQVLDNWWSLVAPFRLHRYWSFVLLGRAIPR